jgi:hypothetical protein
VLRTGLLQRALPQGPLLQSSLPQGPLLPPEVLRSSEVLRSGLRKSSLLQRALPQGSLLQSSLPQGPLLPPEVLRSPEVLRRLQITLLESGSDSPRFQSETLHINNKRSDESSPGRLIVS